MTVSQRAMLWWSWEGVGRTACSELLRKTVDPGELESGQTPGDIVGRPPASIASLIVMQFHGYTSGNSFVPSYCNSTKCFGWISNQSTLFLNNRKTKFMSSISLGLDAPRINFSRVEVFLHRFFYVENLNARFHLNPYFFKIFIQCKVILFDLKQHETRVFFTTFE